MTAPPNLSSALAAWRAVDAETRENFYGHVESDWREDIASAIVNVLRAAAEPEAAKVMTPAERLERICNDWGGALAKMAEGPQPGEPTPYACDQCKGTGESGWYANMSGTEIPCPKCNGTGTVNR